MIFDTIFSTNISSLTGFVIIQCVFKALLIQPRSGDMFIESFRPNIRQPRSGGMYAQDML